MDFRDRQQCSVHSYDFNEEIKSWKYCQIEFEDSSEDEIRNTAQSENLTMGVWLLQNKDSLLNEDIETKNVYATEIPKRFHEHPEVQR